MKPNKMEFIYKKIEKTFQDTVIDELLVGLSQEELYYLADKILEYPFRFKYALIEILQKLFDDTPDFANLLNKFFKRTCSDWACNIIYKPLEKKIITDKNKAFSLVKRIRRLDDNLGISSGILLSMIIMEMDKAKNFMIKGLKSKDPANQKCSLIAFRRIICDPEIKEKRRYLELLKKITPNISIENNNLLIICLQCAFEENKDDFKPILESEMIKRGPEAARSYIKFISHQSNIYIPLVQKAVEILESKEPNDSDIDLGLAEIYESNPTFVIKRLKNRILANKSLTSINGSLLYKIKDHDITPVLKMIEELIDEGNEIMIYTGQHDLQQLFSSIEDWISWCEKWKEDKKKERIILLSLGIILTQLNNYKPSKVRERAISLVKSFAIKKSIDYEIETKGTKLSEKKDGKKNKEDTIKALTVLEKILFPQPSIDIKTLEKNLKRAPYLSRAINKDWLLKSASSKNPHFLAYLFQYKLPKMVELERLIKKFEKETDKTKKFWFLRKKNRLLNSLQIQTYFENVFKILEESKIPINKKKLQNVDNAKDILIEAEVFSRLAPHFKIEYDPKIKVLGNSRLDALIKYKNEEALIEIANVKERDDVLLAHGGISIPGGKIKNVLLTKFKKQLNDGKSDPEIPIIFILNLSHTLGLFEAKNEISGELQMTMIQNGKKNVVQELSTRDNNGFYDEKRTNIVTDIGIIYKQDIENKDPLVGQFCHPHIIPKNRMSQDFRIRLRNALFGDSETSNWKSLMSIEGINEKMARSLYSNGIEDLGVLARIQKGEFIVKGIPEEKLSQLKDEAIRVIHFLLTRKVIFLKGFKPEIFKILQKEKIYFMNDLLKQTKSPKGISQEIWVLMNEDVRRIMEKYI